MKNLITTFFLLIWYNTQSQQFIKVKEFEIPFSNKGLAIYKIEKDDNGYYWISTSDGLIRFDGSFSKDYEPINATSYNSILNKHRIWLNGKEGTNNFQARTDESKIVLFESSYFTSNFSLLLPVQDCNLAYDLIKKNMLTNKSITTDFELKNKTENGFHFVSNNKLYFLDTKGKISEINLGTHELRNYKIIGINEYTLCISFVNNIYKIIKNDNVVNTDKITNPYYLAELREPIQTKIYRDKFYFFDKNVFMSCFINTKNCLEFKKIGEVLINPKPKHYEFNSKSNTLLFINENRNLEKHILCNLNFKLKAPLDKEIITYNNVLYKNKLLDNSQVWSRFFGPRKPTRNYNFNSATICLPNNKLLYYLSDSLYVLDDKKPINPKNTFTFNSQCKNIIHSDSVYYLCTDVLNKYYYNKNTYYEGNINDWPTLGNKLSAIAKSKKPNCLYAIIANSLQEINFKNKTIATLANNIVGDVRSIDVIENQNIIFISTKNHGCYYYYNNSLKHLPFEYYNKKLNSHYVLQDNDGDYWLPTNDGLFLMFKKHLNNFLNGKIEKIPFKKFGIHDGIPNEEFNGRFMGAGIKHKDSIYMANMAGTIIFNPNVKYLDQTINSNLLIDFVSIDSTKIYNSFSSIKIKPNFKQFIIKIAYPFINLDGTIEYQLLGSNDSTWYNIDNSGIIDFKNMKAGQYSINIRPSTNYEKFTTINFTILPYWYNTWWARTLYGLITALSIYIIFMWRLNTKQNKLLALQDATRKKMLTTIAHDLRTPMNNFVHFVDTMKFLIKQKDFETIEAIGNELDKKGRNLQLFLNNILSWSNSNQNLNIVKKEAVNLEGIIKELIPVYTDIAKFRNIEIILTPNANNSNSFISDINLVTVILRNVIDNAIKYAPNNSIIYIQLLSQDKQHSITIKNTTIEHAETIATILNAIFKSKKAPTPYDTHVGFGTSIVYEAIHQLKGSIQYIGNEHELLLKITFQ